MSPGERRDQSSALARHVVEHLQAVGAPPPGAPDGRGIIAAYLGVDPEPDTEPLLEHLHSLGFGVLLPVCEPAYRLSWVDWTPGVVLRKSVRAPVDEPVGPRRVFEDIPDVGLILVPALGVGTSGHRLGQGGGYYDRFLAGHPSGRGSIPRLGLVYRSELLPAAAVPVEPHDQPLDGVFTPDGLQVFGPGSPSV